MHLEMLWTPSFLQDLFFLKVNYFRGDAVVFYFYKLLHKQHFLIKICRSIFLPQILNVTAHD